MKQALVASVLLLTGGLTVASAGSADTMSHADQASQPWIVERGPHHTRWELPIATTNELGAVSIYTNRYTQLETGLNYLEGTNYVESKEGIEITEDGAIARHGQHQVYFSGQLNEDGAVQITMPDGRNLSTRILGLAYHDQTSGKSVLIAELKDCQGRVLANQKDVLYDDAFTDLKASVLYSYSKSGFEQNVILHERPSASPDDYGLDPASTRLEVWTEFQQAPTPRTEDHVEDGSLDEIVDFGSMRMGRGKAFMINKESDSLPVHKRWGKSQQRTFLIEQVKFEDIHPQLQVLPQAPLSEETTAPSPILHRVQPGRVLPPKRLASKSSTKLKMASTTTVKDGFVLDYNIVNTSQTNYVFQGNSTYYVTGPVILSGTTVLESGAVVKFSPTNAPSLTFNGPVNCLSSAYRPAIITSRDDNSVGDLISGSTGSPSGYYAGLALNFSSGTNAITLQNLRICNAQTALALNTGIGHTISHLQLINCQNGIAATNADYNIRNALFWNVSTNFSGLNSTARVEHLTVDAANTLNASQKLYLTNSLLVAVTNPIAMTASNKVFTVSSASGIFQTVKAGTHYLATGSPYRDAGTVTINPALAASLKTLTTFPPLLLGSTISTNTILAPQAQRDSNAPDIGYHYDPLDYMAGGVSFSASVTLTNGVAIGLVGSSAFTSAGGNFSSLGNATNLNRIAYYANVQEQVINLFNPAFLTISSPTTVKMSFTDISTSKGLAAVTTNTWSYDFTMRDCQIRGCTVDIAPLYYTFGLTNNVFDRCTIYAGTNNGVVNSPNTIYIYNNLFYGGLLVIQPHGSCFVRNNLFDGTSATISSGNLNNNGFTAGTFNGLGSVSNVINLTADYQVGPLGRYYYPASGGSLNALNDAGSGSATSFGLYHCTTHTNQVKEGSTTVDIGFHYVALINNVPFDTDVDGIPDYLEDTNGNGICDTGETDWTNSDTDYDGCTDGQELLNGTNPLSASSATPAMLGYWRFNTGAWQGDQGQLPTTANNLALVPSWNTNAVKIDSTSAANLTYREVESKGLPNVNCRSGSIRFWFAPDWDSTGTNNGTGPQCESRLIELGTKNSTDGWWALVINPAGTQLSLCTASNTAIATNLTIPIMWASNEWHQVLLTYSNSASAFYIDGAAIATNGAAITRWPNQTARSQGFRVGSDAAGILQVRGAIDDLQTYNYPLTTAEIANGYPTLAILTQPKAQSVIRGSNATFYVIAAGPNLTYQWRVNGLNITGATNSSYTKVNALTSANYSVVVSNSYGTVTSANAYLTVLIPSSILTQPTSQTNPAGSTVFLSVTASGTAPLSYQWYKNGSPLSISDRITNVVSPQLQIVDSTADDAGIYNVVVTNVAGSVTSSSATLAVITNATLARWHFDTTTNWWRGDNNALDSTGGQDGTLYGTAGYAAISTNVLFKFDGQPGYISFGKSAGNFGTNNFTIDFWITTSATYTLGILGKRPACGADNMWDLRMESNGKLALEVGQDSSGTYYTGIETTAINDGNRHHIVISRQAALISIYIDGTLNASASTTGIINFNNTTELFAGKSTCTGCDGTGYLNGTLDEIKLICEAPFVGEQGQQPLAYANVAVVSPGWSNSAVYFNTNAAATLIYRDIETNGRPNISLKTGTIRFWFKPDWSSTTVGNGTGPQTAGRFLEVGSYGTTNDWWALLLNSNGTQISFVTQTNGLTLTNLTAPISWAAGQWHQLALTYSPNNSTLYIDGNAIQTFGTGTAYWPRPSVRAQGFRLGADSTGGQQVKGTFDELETFNYVLDALTIANGVPGPVIVTQPANVGVGVGSNATFIVVAGGKAPLTYQWRLSGTNIPGATLPTYTRSNVQLADQGNYSVMVSSPGGSVTSTNAVLTVYIPPSITVQPVNQSLNQGSTATLSVTAAGSDPLCYQWAFKGTNILGATNRTYTITEIRSTDAGSYSAVISNSGGAIVSSNALITVNSKALLGSWHFDSGWTGEQGQSPIASASLTTDLSWGTNGPPNAVMIADANAKLAYHDVETSGSANITCPNGCVRFWFKPRWTTTNSGPQHVIRLIEIGQSSADYSNGWWTLSINALGNQMSFVTQGAGVNTTNLSVPIQFVSNYWYQVALTYSTNDVSGLYINGELVSTGACVLHWPAASVRRLGFRVGCGVNSSEQADGAIDELQTFNYPLDYQTVCADYQRIAKTDSDHDGLTDLLENTLGTRPDKVDTDNDGMPDGWEFAHMVAWNPSNPNAFSIDPRFNDASKMGTNQISNLEAYQTGIDPLHKADPVDLVSCDTVLAEDLINIDISSPESPVVTGAAVLGASGADAWNKITYQKWGNNILPLDDWALQSANGTLAGHLQTVEGPFTIRANVEHDFSWWAWWATDRIWIHGTYPTWVKNLFVLKDPWQLQNQTLLDGALWPGTYKWNPIWYPLFCNEGHLPSDWHYNIQDMYDTSLAPLGFLENDPFLVNFQVLASDGYSPRLYLTGLSPGDYVIYFYGNVLPQVNGEYGEPFIWENRVVEQGKSQSYYNNCTRNFFKMGSDVPEDHDSFEYFLQRNGNPIDAYDMWMALGDQTLIDPHWLASTPRVRIDFTRWSADAVRELRGIQVARLKPINPPNLSGRSGKRSSYLSWNGVATAGTYQIFRAQGTNDQYVQVGQTSRRCFVDNGVPPWTTNFYKVIAFNPVYTSSWSSVVSVIPYDDPGNAPPTLGRIGPITISEQDNAFRIPFSKLLEASDAWDVDWDPISFKVTNILSGILMINGSPYSSTNCIIDSKADVSWAPSGPLSRTNFAFSVRAFDGYDCSIVDVEVPIAPGPQTALVGWGMNELGGLGNGTLNFDPNRYNQALVSQVYPTRVKNLNNVAKVATTGWRTGAAVTADGKLWMWGWGQYSGWGGVANGTNYGDFYTEPFKVQTLDDKGHAVELCNVQDVCLDVGSVFVLKNDGSVWSWGGWDDDDPYGQYVGHDHPSKCLPVEGLPPIVQLCDDGMSCLALGRDGSVWWWGEIDINEYYWSVEQKTWNEDIAVFDLKENSLASQYRPNQQSALSNIVQIAASGGHYIALRRDGAVFEFGYVPRLLMLSTDTNCDVFHADCAFIATPTQVPNIPTNIVQIATDADFSLAVTKDGAVWAWGDQSGGWASEARWGWNWSNAVPQIVKQLTNIAKVSMAPNMILAVDKSGHAFGWGGNPYGQMMTLPLDWDCSGPKPLVGLDDVVDVCAGQDMCFAIASLDDGRPQRVVATGLDRAVRLDWRKYTGASRYNVYRCEPADQEPSLAADNELVGTTVDPSFLDTLDLVNHTEYGYKITAIVDDIETLPSRLVTAIPRPAPQSVDWADVMSNGQVAVRAILGTCRGIQLNWISVFDATQYKVFRAGSASGPFTMIARPVGDTYTDNEVQAGQSYWYYIVASNAVGDSPASQVLSSQLDPTVCLPAPILVSAVPDANTNLVVRWMPAANNGISADTYRVKWYFGNHSPNSAMFIANPVSADSLRSNPDGSVSYTFPRNQQLSDNLIIWLKVSGSWNGEEGADSLILGPLSSCTTCSPAVPVVTPTAGCHQVFLSWPSDPLVDYYEIRSSATSSGTSTLLGKTSDNRYWHTGLDPLKTYYYTVTAVSAPDVNTLRQSKISSEVSCRPSTNCPTSVTFTAVADAYNSEVYVHWESLTNYMSYQCFVERKDAENDYQPFSLTGVGNGFIDTNVVNGVTYTYRVNVLDSNYNRFQSETAPVIPSAGGGVVLIGTAGNGYVKLQWGSAPGCQYQLGHSQQPGGPYEILGQAWAGPYYHLGVQNGTDHYYVLTAIPPVGEPATSPEVRVRPLATLQPMAPSNFYAEPGDGKVILTWQAASGAVSYRITGPGDTVIGTTSGTSFAYTIPTGTTNGTQFSFKVVALNATGLVSDVSEITVTYNATTTSEPQDQVILFIGDHQVGVNDSTLQITAPTNLVLRASVKTPDATRVYFYADGTLIGTGDAPDASVVWYQVPGGQHSIVADALTPPGQSVDVGGPTFSSETGKINVSVVPDLAGFQTAATDLQIPAPGLPIVLSRAYDSRKVAASGCLGAGWTASWDEPCLKISSTLAEGWSEGGVDNLSKSQYYIAENTSHMVTITLPGGGIVDFGAQLSSPQGLSPLYDLVMFSFQPFALNQGTLSSPDLEFSELSVTHTNGETGGDWGSAPLLVKGCNFDAISFVYTSPDGVNFTFEGNGLTKKLTKIADRNGNTLTYNYDTSNRVRTITSSNKRAVTFDYSLAGCIKVSDPVGVNPVLKYFIQNGQLTEVDKLTGDRTAGVYETIKYRYGTSGDSQGLLTEAFDARHIRVFGNQYGHDVNNVPNGTLAIQTNVARQVINYSIVTNQVAVSQSVNGSVLTAVVNHSSAGAVSNVKKPGEDTGVTYTYGALGQVVTETDAANKTKDFYYDGQGRMIGQSDELGHSTSSELNEYGQVLTRVNPNGIPTQFEYDENGNLTYSLDAAGLQTTYTYYSGGLMATRQQYAPSLGYTNLTRYTYFTNSSNPSGDLQSVIECAVDGAGQIVGAGSTNSYQYDANGNRITETRFRTKNGTSEPIVTSYRYDAQNRVTNTVDALTRTSSIVFNSLGKQASTTDALGRQTICTYDASGNLIETLYPDSTVTRTVYDDLNRPVVTQERTTPSNNDTTASATVSVYDSAGRVIRVEHRSQVKLTKQTGSNGSDYTGDTGAEVQYKMIVSDNGALGSFTRTVYDVNGRVRYSMSERGAVTRYDYDDAGRRTNTATYTVYKADLSNVSSDLNPTGATAETACDYDPNGNQLWTRDALGRQTDYTYDVADRLTVTTYPALTGQIDRATRRTGYDALGRRIRETDEAEVTTQYGYDFRGLLTSVVQTNRPPGSDAPPTVITNSYGYDEVGNLIAQTNGNGNVTWFEYDKLGRRTKRILPDNSWESIAFADVFEPNSTTIKVTQETATDFAKKVIIRLHDRLDRLSKVTLPAINQGESGTTVTYEYTDFGKRARVIQTGDTARIVLYAYDYMNRLRAKSTPEGTISYDYDFAGAVTNISARKTYNWSANPPYKYETLTGSTTSASSAQWGYCYDVLGRIAKVNADATSADCSYTFDPVGNLQTTTLRNGLKTTYTYNERNFLRQLQTTNAANLQVASFDYDGPDTDPWTRVSRLSPTGQRRQLTERITGQQGPLVNRTANYSYDNLSRITHETISSDSTGPSGEVYYNRYDNDGNCGDKSSTYPLDVLGVGSFIVDFNALDQPSNATNDPNGNVQNYNSTNYLYDAENHLKKMVRPDGGGVLLTYDADGNRVSKQTFTMTSTNPALTYLVEDLNPTGYAQVMEERVANAPTTTYVYGLDLISLSTLSPQVSTSYYGYDGQGSVRYLSSPSGTITDTYAYDAYGVRIASTGTTPNNYLYTGEQWDSDLGMYYLRARYCRPELGRMWTMDNYEGYKQVPASLHKYTYAECDPINKTDPSGLSVATDNGIEVHRYIGQHFMKTVAGGVSGPSVVTILKDIPGFPGLPAKLEGVVTALFPDLTSTLTKEVYEIKPDSVTQIALGEAQLEAYIDLFNYLDPSKGWHRGTSYVAPLNVPVNMLQYAVTIKGPPGMILYHVFDLKKMVKRKAIQVGVAEANDANNSVGIASLNCLSVGF